MSWNQDTAARPTTGCDGCVHYRGVRWIGEAQRIRCAQSDEPNGYASVGVLLYAGCGLRKTASERQRELF